MVEFLINGVWIEVYPSPTGWREGGYPQPKVRKPKNSTHIRGVTKGEFERLDKLTKGGKGGGAG